MSDHQDNQFNQNSQIGKNDTSEKRPLTSYGQNNSQGIRMSSSGGFQNYSGVNQRGAMSSPKIMQGLKGNTSGFIRPSTVSSQNGIYDPSQNQTTVKSQKMPNISNNVSNAFFLDKGNQQTNKKIPNKIMHDKERLYETQLQLRSTINALQEENIKLKTKNLNLEREAKKFERIIEEGNVKTVGAAGNQQKENALSIRLRKQVKECLKEIEQKNIEFENFKRQITTTRLQELEIEVNVLREECIKLKSKLEQCLKVNQGFGFDQTGSSNKSGTGIVGLNKKVEALKNDNLEMAVLIQQIEKEKSDINVKEKEADRQLKRLQKEKGFMQKQLQLQEEELRKLRMEGINSPYGKKLGQNTSQNNGLAEYNSKLKSDLEKIGKENSKLNNQLIAKIENLKVLEEKQKRDTQEWQERIESIRIQKEIAERNYNQEQLANKNLEEKVRALEEIVDHQQQQQTVDLVRLDSDNSIRHKKTDSIEMYSSQMNRGQQQQQYSTFHHQRVPDNTQSQYVISNNSEQKADQRQPFTTLNIASNDKQRASSKKPSQLLQKKLVTRVNLYDVNKIGRDVRFSLKTKKIKYEDIDKYLITPDLRKKGKVNILEMVAILQKEPFCIGNDDDALSVARYIIEDNSEDKIIFDEQRTNDINVVKTVFRNLVGKYENLNAKDELKIHEDITDIFTKFSSGLKENIELYTKQKKENSESGICKLEDLEKAMSYCDAEFSPRHTDYIIMKIYEDSKDTEKVYYDKLLAAFDKKEFQNVREQLQKEIEQDEILEQENEQQNKNQQDQVQKEMEIAKLLLNEDQEDYNQEYDDEKE